MRAILPLLIAGLAAALAACGPKPEAPAPEATPAPAVVAPAESEPAEATAAAPAMADPAYPEAQSGCLDAVAAQTNLDRDQLVVTEVLWAEAGVGVTIEVPGAQAPWSCLADEDGTVHSAYYSGSEGAL